MDNNYYICPLIQFNMTKILLFLLKLIGIIYLAIIAFALLVGIGFFVYGLLMD